MTETTEPVSAYPNGTGWAGGLGHGVTHRRYRISKHSPPLPVCSCNCNFWVLRSSFTQVRLHTRLHQCRSRMELVDFPSDFCVFGALGLISSIDIVNLCWKSNRLRLCLGYFSFYVE